MMKHDLQCSQNILFCLFSVEINFCFRDRMAYLQRKSCLRNNQKKVKLSYLPPTERHLLDWNCSMVKRSGETSVNDCWLTLGSQNIFLFMFAEVNFLVL